MKLSSRIVAAVLLIVGSSGVVYAFAKHNHWGMTAGDKIEFVTEKVTQKLDLDSQQKQRFSDLAETVVNAMTDIKATRTEHINEIEALLQDSGFNQLRAIEMVQQKTQMINDKAPLVIASLAAFLDSLSAEQKQAMKEFIRHHRHGDNH